MRYYVEPLLRTVYNFALTGSGNSDCIYFSNQMQKAEGNQMLRKWIIYLEFLKILQTILLGMNAALIVLHEHISQKDRIAVSWFHFSISFLLCLWVWGEHTCSAFYTVTLHFCSQLGTKKLHLYSMYYIVYMYYIYHSYHLLQSLKISRSVGIEGPRMLSHNSPMIAGRQVLDLGYICQTPRLEPGSWGRSKSSR